jgi:type II secretory pathway component GspD/PulD (secretin)
VSDISSNLMHDGGSRGRGFLVRLLLLTFLTVCLNIIPAPVVAQGLSVRDSEFARAKARANEFMKAHRYNEAIAYINGQLAIISDADSRISMLLLLSDARKKIGDTDGAIQALREAKTLATTKKQTESIAERGKKLGYVIEVPPVDSLSSDSTRSVGQASEATGQEAAPVLITNSFFETDMRQVLSDLAMSAGKPIVWDKSVEGIVTYEAKNQPLEDVLRAILYPAGFTFKLQDGIYYVGSIKTDNPAFGLLSSTKVVTLSNTDATEAIGMLSDYFKPYVKATKTNNTVCITAPEVLINRIVDDLKEMDAAPVQIMIEVIITEVSKDALRQMGLDWSLTHVGAKSNWTVGADHTNIDSPALKADYGQLGVDMGGYSVDLAASLQALVTSGKARIRANPHLVTLNGRTAEIALTKDQYFIINTGNNQLFQYNTLQAISSGIKLQITPFASDSGEITVKVAPEVGDVTGSGANGLPEINKRTANTSVRVHDGQTFTIGGLDVQSDKNVRRKIPLLGDLPILGYFFRYDEQQSRDTEVIIFVTPHIMKD